MSQITALEQTRWWKAILSIEHSILVITSVLAAFIVTAGVVMRYCLHINFFGQEEILTVVALWLYWAGGIDGSVTDTHIGADLTDVFIKSWAKRRIIKIITLLISIGVICVFIYWGLDYTTWVIALGGTTTGLKIPLIISKITMLIGFVFMGLYSIYHLIRVIQSKESDYQKEEEK